MVDDFALMRKCYAIGDLRLTAGHNLFSINIFNNLDKVVKGKTTAAFAFEFFA
jgi:hypothetical protein